MKKSLMAFICVMISAQVINAQNVGIGTTTPLWPLSFPGTLGDKISFWTDGTPTHYGIGIQQNTLQIFAKTDFDDIAFGYGSSSSFTEKMRIKGNGALVMNGNAGTTGQILQSNGPNTSPTWVNNIHYVGENFGGGIVVYVYDNGHHGLIASTFDQSSGIRWNAGTNTNTMAKTNGLEGGKSNTSLIITSQNYGDGETYAARLCNEYGAFTDGTYHNGWYLPSVSEFFLMVNSGVVPNLTGTYWTSYEQDHDNAWIASATSNFYMDKNSLNKVRAIRAF